SPSSRSARSSRSSTPACMSSSPTSSATTTGSATRSPPTTVSTDGGAMRLKISHRTEYRYDTPVPYALQRLRLVPRGGSTQTVHNWSRRVEGASEEVRFIAHFETDTRLVSIMGEATAIRIDAGGEVDTGDTAGIHGEHKGFAPLWLFQHQTALTAPGGKLRE